jgi:hypothetical protein
MQGDHLVTAPQSDTIHQKLLALLDHGKANHEAFVATLSQAEREAVGTETGWQPKDHVAHLNYWRSRTVKLLRAALGEGEVPESGADFQPQNERNFTEWQHATWDAVAAQTASLDAEARTLLGRLSAQDLEEARRFPWQTDDRTLSVVIGADFVEHPAEHYSQLYRERGLPERGTAMMDDSARFIGELYGTTSREYAVTLYNAGCYHARNGMSTEAIAAVGQALRLAPDLTDWSKQDADLDSLRDLPDFQAIYQ